jgi:hypothetical protein
MSWHSDSDISYNKNLSIVFAYASPWYYEDEISYPFQTPEYTFEEGSLKRLKY